MPLVIVFPVSSVTSVLLVLMLSLFGVSGLSLTILYFLGTLPVIFLLFVLANMMIRPELFPDMNFSALLRMVLTCLNRKRRNMLDKIRSLFKGLASHLVSGCTICSGFARHFAKTVVQILKGGNTYKKS